MKRNTGRPRQAHGKKKEFGGRYQQWPKLFCPSCATLGQRVLLSGTHFRRNGVTTREFACSCGWNKVVEYHTR